MNNTETQALINKPRSFSLPDNERDSLAANQRLRITEIFHSLQGEGRFVGEPTLRCHYCDSEYAFFGGNWMNFHEVHAAIDSFGASTICVTGGEPLAQPNCVGNKWRYGYQ